MNRSIATWRECDPNAMAFNQSDAAKFHAFTDARADILELAGAIEAMRVAGGAVEFQAAFDKAKRLIGVGT